MRFLLSVAFLVIACSTLYAQAQPQSQKVKIDQVDPLNPNGPRVLQFDPANFKKGPQTKDTVRVLVKLQGGLSQSTSRSKTDIDSQHQRFYSDLRKLTGASANQRTSEAQTVVHYEYRETFNGFALTTSGRIAENLKSLPYVAAVLEDKLVKVSGEESNNVIKAQQARQVFGVSGKNIRIGIIDTGIDYTHPDLGQGFGPSFKVVGGYDFVNDDSDPMDDHGHGTHVAGIAAANGVVYKGVAPDAKLVAYKVLSSSGYGYDSWILAAIERTVDPDQNPATDDALDVVNMSLGRTPDANEPMSEAVNNAVSKGVVFCIAAGNSGGYFTVGTPGIAASAITVGATDNYLNTAYFSSKGPTEDLRLKPEVSAPGVDITSTVPQNGYQSMSGTSMATPHVTGAVALILEKHPELTAEKIKNLLMTTAQTPFTSSPWEQGTGVIDVYKALNTSPSFTVNSGFLNFGLADATPSVNKTRTFLLKNTSGNAQTFNLTSEGTLNSSPMSLVISPAQVTLQAGGEQLVTATLSSSAEVALQNLPDAYTGRIQISNGTTTTRIESAFMNPQHTDIHFEGQLPDLFIILGIDGSFYWMPYYPRPDGSSMRLYLPKAKYDIVTLYDYSQRFLITEGIDTEENVNVTLRKADIKNTIAFKPLNENGEAITIDGSNYVMGSALFNGNNRNIITIFPGFVDTLYISDTEHYGLEFSYNNPANGKYYDVSAGTGWGISSSGAYSNDPDKFSKITLKNPSLPPGESQMTTTFIKLGAPGFWMTTWNPYPIELPATFDFYQTQRASSSGNFGMFFSFKPQPGKSGYVWETYDIRSEEGDLISFNQHVDRKQITIHKKEFEYTFGRTIPVFNMAASHYENLIRHETFLGRGAFIHAFGEHPRGTTSYHLHQNGATIKKGNIFQSMYTESDSYMESIAQSPGQYNLDFEYRDFQTGGKFAVAKLSTTFNTSNADKNPPHVKSVRLVSNDEDTNELQTSNGAELLLTIQDGCDYCYTSGIKTPAANFKKQDAANWTALTIQSLSANEFKASLPAGLEQGYYVLQIKGEDNEGNKFVYEVTPAFYVGEEPSRTPFTTVNLISPRNNSHPGTTPSFEWTAVTADTYTLQISDDLSFEHPTELTSTQNKFSLETPLEENTVYYWRVKPNGSNSSGAWSSIFRFESRILAAPELISPEDDAEVGYGNTEFSWSSAKDAYGYQLEISTKEDFSVLNYAYRIGDTELSVYLYPGQQYYWRVKAFFYLGWFEEESVSSVRTINIKGSAAPILSSPADDSKDVDLSTTFMWSGSGVDYSYLLEVSKDENFTNVAWSVTAYSTSYTINLEPLTEYFWRVTNYDYFGGQHTSQVFSFTTKNISPPTLVSPVNNSTDVQLTTTFVWSVGESDISYLFELSKNEGFTTVAKSATVTTNYMIVDDLTPGTNYFWRVTRKIQTGSKRTSEAFKLTTKSIAPPTLLFPANNSTGVQSATNFSWSSGESNSNYLFELSKKEDFTNVVQSVSVQSISIVIDNLEPATDYFWRVSQMYGSDKITSAVYRFTSAPVTSTEATESALNYSVPNPFSTSVEIVIHSNISQDASINIVDPVGRVIKQISVQLTTGSNSVSWDAADDHGDFVAPGIYFAFIHRAGQAPCVIRMMRLNH